MIPSRRMPRTFEGRLLPRPEEPAYDQGLHFDLATLMSRRRALHLLGLGAGVIGLAACSSTASDGAASTGASTEATLGQIPDETAGPFPGNGSNGPDVLSEQGVVRSDIRSSFGASAATAAGVPMTLELTVRDLADGAAGLAGAAVYVWHCDREGRYSMYSSGIAGENYLRGVQVADADGRVRFTSIFPACYPGRWPHVHFEVYPDRSSLTEASEAIVTSQLALPAESCDQVYATAGYERSVNTFSRLSLQTDGVFGDDAAVRQLASVTGDVTTGFTATLDVGVDPRG